MTSRKFETRFWNDTDVYTAIDRLSSDDLNELYEDMEANGYESEGKQLLEAIKELDDSKYQNVLSEVEETAREEVKINYQPDWAWSLLSVHPEELDTSVLDVPSRGGHKGLLLAESGDTLGLYPKDKDEISEVQHVERWALNADNMESLGYEIPSDYDRGAVTIGEETVSLLTMDFNGDMLLRSNLQDYATAFVSETKAEEIASEFEKKLKNSYVRQFEDLHHRDKRFPEFEEVSENSLFPLQIGITAGEIVCSGKEDYTRNEDNVAFVLPRNWHSGRVEPEELWSQSRLIITDLGEYTDTNSSNMMDEDPFLDEDQKADLVGSEKATDDDEFSTYPTSGSSHDII